MAKTFILLEPHEHEQSEPDEKVVHLLSRVGCLDPEQGEESHFVGRRRGHVYIQEALSLEPLDLRLYPQGSGSLLPIHLPHPSA